MLHNKLGLEHDWDSDSPFSNDVFMLTNHAKKYLLPVFLEQPTFENDICYLVVTLITCYTVVTKSRVLHNELGLEHDWNSDSPSSYDILMLTNHA